MMIIIALIGGYYACWEASRKDVIDYALRNAPINSRATLNDRPSVPFVVGLYEARPRTVGRQGRMYGYESTYVWLFGHVMKIRECGSFDAIPGTMPKEP